MIHWELAESLLDMPMPRYGDVERRRVQARGKLGDASRTEYLNKAEVQISPLSPEPQGSRRQVLRVREKAVYDKWPVTCVIVAKQMNFLIDLKFIVTDYVVEMLQESVAKGAAVTLLILRTQFSGSMVIPQWQPCAAVKTVLAFFGAGR